MVLNNENKGLCETCNKKKNCSHFAVVNGPVVCCEEHDDYTPRQEVLITVSQPVIEERPLKAKKCTDDVKGLCIDCENIKACTITRNCGGVWHCEEYK